ncbi:MAG: hypothetical protein PHU27_07615 [Salinivirgaceae bacterium]|nr:hypothetical protein [Salinivirgaceae bacterium]MDD4747046.1 hypothetical protein [Salinivirgaceae bacterium]MDY0280324.1 hypothetical protein [Salinivirgaceae bacterium]
MKVDTQTLILDTLAHKSIIKQTVYNNTLESFKMLKSVCKYIAQNTRKSFRGSETKITVEYRENGAFQVELHIAGDLLVFVMHTNVFLFDRSNPVWKTPILTKDPDAAYCGMINIYNFLADSFKYDRGEDMGYMIGRIFINRNMNFMVEGKRQLGVLYNNFGNEIIDKRSMRDVIQSAILYSLDFDLLVPPYDQAAIVTVDQMKIKNSYANMKTGKRLGFKFYNENDQL